MFCKDQPGRKIPVQSQQNNMRAAFDGTLHWFNVYSTDF